MLEDDIEGESYTVISIDSLLIYDKKFYLQVYLDKCAYETVNKQMTGYLDENLFEDQILQMLYYDRIDITKGNDIAKSNNGKSFMICHYWFLNHGLNFQDYVCNSCHDLTMLSANISNITIHC